jgi:uncharacterized membrane protein YtjA (UPF0391 family)
VSLLWWAFIAFVVAIVAGALGFRGVESGAATIAKVLFGIFLVLALIFLVMALTGVALVT